MLTIVHLYKLYLLIYLPILTYNIMVTNSVTALVISTLLHY